MLEAGDRVAAIDIGTNSVLLLVAELCRDDGRLTLQPVVERATITRLGQGVDRTRELAPDAVERTLACLNQYGEEIRSLGVKRIDAVGTSAMRDARGSEGFRCEAKRLLGIEPRVIGGEEEARLTFIGGLSGIEARGPVSVFDIGGGSTELIRGDLATRVESAVSLNVGSVRLTERHIKSDPPTSQELEACRADIERELDGLTGPSSLAQPLVGVAGTVTTIAAIARNIAPYDGARVHGLTLTLDEVRTTSDLLARTRLAERVELPGLSPKRADVIVAGALLCRVIVERSGAPGLTVSDRGVRWGVAEALTHRR